MQKLRNSSFAINNILIFPESSSTLSGYEDLIEKGLIYSTSLKIKAYNTNEPIYIKDSNGKIFELSHHPERKCDWNSKITYLRNLYAYIPFLRFHNIPNDKIDELSNFCSSAYKSYHSTKDFNTVFMKPMQIDNNVENHFLEL